MEIIKTDILLRSAFGTQPKGDTLFGHLCWMIRNRFGMQRLAQLLEGYTEGSPFAVVSDAFPSGHLPRPSLPGHWFETPDAEDRKAVKKRVWLPESQFTNPVKDFLKLCRSDIEWPLGGFRSRLQPHNSIDRRTGTTGSNFAPYSMNQYWYEGPTPDGGLTFEPKLSVYVAYDEERIRAEELSELLADIGAFGFGRDASIGLGKFQVLRSEPIVLRSQPHADAWYTLAPCALQGMDLIPERTFYQVFTRFGKHGDVAVYKGRPFKAPVLLAQTAAVLTPKIYREVSFIGSGLGGDGSLSKAIKETVHQGYAPVIGIHLPDREGA